MPPIVDSGRNFLGDESLSKSQPRASRERLERAGALKLGGQPPQAWDRGQSSRRDQREVAVPSVCGVLEFANQPRDSG